MKSPVWNDLRLRCPLGIYSMSSQPLDRSQEHRDEVRPWQPIELKMHSEETVMNPLPPLIPSPHPATAGLFPLLIQASWQNGLCSLLPHFPTPTPKMVFTQTIYSETSSKVYARQNFASWLLSSGIYSCNCITLHGRQDFADVISVTDQWP